MLVGCMAEAIFSRAMGWFEKQAEKEAKNDTLKKSDRFGQIIGIIGVVICIIFFGYHLTKPTGFFTPAFGTFDAALFFGINIFGIFPQFIRLVMNQKTPSRPFDIINSVLLFVALIYFVATFPFDFSHFADPLPMSLEFLLNWVSNGLASALMVLGILGMLFALPYQTLLYLAIRKLPLETKSQSPDSAQTPKPEEVKEEAK
jgi:succinate dehydrogenase/fumarate reductase cytochrome b subunit